MNAFVLDASLAMTWCFTSQGNATTRAIYGLAQTSVVHVPGLWFLELTHVLVRAERKGDRTHYENECFLSFLREGVSPLEDSRPVSETSIRATDLARAHNLSTYDAAYLELALHKGLPLATLDKDLIKAARKMGVGVVGEDESPVWEVGEDGVGRKVAKKKSLKRSRL